jgi:hypothetical protein
VTSTSALAQNALAGARSMVDTADPHRQIAQPFRFEKLPCSTCGHVFDHAQRLTRMLRNAPHPTMSVSSPAAAIGRPSEAVACLTANIL